jgi:sugar phosphate isomerase/epimerase
MCAIGGFSNTGGLRQTETHAPSLEEPAPGENDHPFSVFLGTILLEPNRWPDRPASTYSRIRGLTGMGQPLPRVRASEWLARARRDGFDGIELWENHALCCDDEEFARLRESPLPISVYSSYFGLDDASAARRQVAGGMVRDLGARGVKYNFGPDAERADEYLRNLRAWAEGLDPDVRMICECHAGNIAESPLMAASLLETLGDTRFEAILHLTNRDGESLFQEALRHLGPRVRHIHVGWASQQGREWLMRRVRILRDHGFTGTFTIEFTTGIEWGKPQPDPGILYRNAVADLELLKEVLAS